MATEVSVQIAGLELVARLNDGPTAPALVALLPVEGEARGFGGEMALALPPVELPSYDEENVEPRTNEVKVGTLAFWPPANALTLYCGPTPLTPLTATDGVITSSAVIVVGELLDLEGVDLSKVDATQLQKMRVAKSA